MPRDKSHQRQALVYGIHAVRHALMASPADALELWVMAGARKIGLSEAVGVARAQALAVHEVPSKTLDRLTNGARHQGIVLRRRTSEPLDERALITVLGSRASVPLLLVLDGIQDPHNLGACLRTADAAGVDAVIIPRHRSVGLTGTVSKVASGAVETVPVIQARNLARALVALQEADVRLVGADDDAEPSVFDVDLRGPTALVMGGEDRGLRRLTREHCDLLVRIPMYGQVESLNVAVATGVCLYEAVRQRRNLLICK